MRKGSVGIVAVTLLLALSSSSDAYLGSPLNTKRLVDSAELVCHGKVLSVGPSAIEADSAAYPPLHTRGGVARVRILNTIKGRPPEQIDVVFRVSTDFVVYTSLQAGEECILFLRRRGDAYRFVDDHNGTLEIPPHQPIPYKSEVPDLRMIEELLLGTRAGTGRVQLVSAEQLGEFSHDWAIGRLAELTREADMAIQGVAYAALIELDRPPSAAELASFFAKAEDTKSLERYRTTAYSNSSLKLRILGGIDGRLNVIGRDFDLQYTSPEYVARRESARAAAARWKDFDVIAFLRSVLSWEQRTDPRDAENWVIAGRDVADIVGNQLDWDGTPAIIKKTYRKGSRAIVIGLLESRNWETRFAAARAIDRMIAAPHEFPYPQHRQTPRFGDELDVYVRACLTWLDAHRGWAKEDE